MNLDGIDWVIAGGNFTFGARPVQEAWISDIRDCCIAADKVFLQVVGWDA